MKFFSLVLSLCLAGFLGFEYYQLLQPSTSMSVLNSAHPLKATHFSYGDRYRQFPASLAQTEPSESRPTTASDRLKKITKKELRKFKSILDLPSDSFTYIVSQLDFAEIDQLMSCGLILIQSYPKKARRYGFRLLICQLALNPNPADKEVAVAESDPDSDATFTGNPASADGIVTTFTGSALSFYNGLSWTKLIDFLWLMLQTLYYTTTVTGCLLVAFFIGDQLRDRPFAKPVNASMPSWSHRSTDLSSLASSEPGKTYPHAVPL